jgi:hypothetical protein
MLIDLLITFSLMRRRTKIEVEIRNILSDVLLVSLRDKEIASLLYMISRFCLLIKEKGSNRIKLTELLKYEENIFVTELDWSKLINRPSKLDILEIDSENYIKFKSRFERHLSSICIRSRLYWNFVSGLYSKKEKFKSSIEGKIKKGILLFNEGFYFECHELFEEMWKEKKGNEKVFLKGLIHAAVAFYHLEYENYKGAINYLMRSYKRLKEFEPIYLGVDIETFLVDLESYLKHFDKSSTHNLELLKNTVPRIGLVE